MNSNPLVSIAIPTYKSKYLRAAVESALGQTYHNIEVIIVNDKSPETETIVSIVDSFQDDRICYYENDLNLGSKDPANNWDKCLSYAKGDYFCLLCDDDIYMPTFIEEMMVLTDQFTNCNVFRARGCIVNKEGGVTSYYPSSPQWESSEDYMYHVFRRLRFQTISEFFYRTSHIKGIGGFVHFPLAWHADYFSILVFSKIGGIASNSKPLVMFRLSGENISSRLSSNCEKKAEANFLAFVKAGEIINTADPLFMPLLNNELQNWKYFKDLDLARSVSLWGLIKLFRLRKKYHIVLEALLKGVVSHII